MADRNQEILDMLVQRGVLEDRSIEDEELRKIRKRRKQATFHNTQMLLENYRSIIWMAETIPEGLAQELETPLKDLDALIDRVEGELAFRNRRLESRMDGAVKTRLLIDRINEALSVLTTKPGNGQALYDVIYESYINPNRLPVKEILSNAGISQRTYYRMRKEAISLIALKLWSAPTPELETWLDVLAMLERNSEI